MTNQSAERGRVVRDHVSLVVRFLLKRVLPLSLSLRIVAQVNTPGAVGSAVATSMLPYQGLLSRIAAIVEYQPAIRDRSYSTFPSRRAGRRMELTRCPRRVISSGLVTMISLATGISDNSLRMAIADSRLFSTCGSTTSRSTSLSGCASPRACEPKRMTRTGWNRRTIRSVISAMASFVVIARPSSHQSLEIPELCV